MSPNQSESESSSTELGKPLPLPIEILAEQVRWFDRFKAEILSKGDTVEISDKPHIKRSGTRKLALAFGVSDDIISIERVPKEGKDSEGNYYYRIISKAYHPPTGRVSIGVAIASWNEKKSWPHGEHDVLTLAHTRSKSRAVLDLCGGGEVSAEEMLPGGVEHSEPVADQLATTGWHVPSEKLASPTEEFSQESIFHGTRQVGTAYISSQFQEVSLIPEVAPKADSGPVEGFLRLKFLEPLGTKHPDFHYSLRVDSGGYLQTILVRMPLEEKRLKELLDAVGWTFAKAGEAK